MEILRTIEKEKELKEASITKPIVNFELINNSDYAIADANIKEYVSTFLNNINESYEKGVEKEFHFPMANMLAFELLRLELKNNNIGDLRLVYDDKCYDFVLFNGKYSQTKKEFGIEHLFFQMNFMMDLL